MGLFPKRVVSAGLNPIQMDRDGWVREYLQVRLVDRRGVETIYGGLVLKGTAALGHSLQFTGKATALRPARG